MTLVTCFDNLPDLVLIELFSHLSSYDILWGWSRLNHRLAILIIERGFFYRVNLSMARYHQFNTILAFLPLNNILSISIDSDASPLQLTRWPYLPRLRTLRIIGVHNHDDLSLFLLLHAATLTHLIIQSNGRMTADGFSIKLAHPIGDMLKLINNILLIHLPALRSLDLGMNYYGTRWPFNTEIVPLTYLRLSLPSMDILLRLILTKPLANTLRQLHVKIGSSHFNNHSPVSISNLSIRMANLHTFTFVQTFFSMLTIEWIAFEMLTSSTVMPILRRANVSLFISTNDLNFISSSPLFTDDRHVDVHFVFNLLNCPQYIKMTPYIPRGGNRFHSREIVGATFVVNYWSDRSEWLTDGDPFSRGRQYYHHMWYSLPWTFNQFFYEDIPRKWITEIRIFHAPCHHTMTIDQSFLRELDVAGQYLPSCISFLPHVALSSCIETLNMSFYNRTLRINLPALRNITLVNSINCLNYSSKLPPTVCSMRIHLFHSFPNYMPPNWPVVLQFLSTLPQLSSLRVSMYDLPKTIDDKTCHLIAKATSLFRDFGFYFRRRFHLSDNDDIEAIFKDHTKFIERLCHYTLLVCLNKQPYYYSIEDDGCGLNLWF